MRLTKLSPLWNDSSISIIFHKEKIASNGLRWTQSTLSNFLHQFIYSFEVSSNGSCWNTGKWALRRNLLSGLHSPGLFQQFMRHHKIEREIDELIRNEAICVLWEGSDNLQVLFQVRIIAYNARRVEASTDLEWSAACSLLPGEQHENCLPWRLLY